MTDKTSPGPTYHLLLSGAALVAGSTFLSRLLGLVRDRLFASHFGAGTVLDAYFAAYRIPDLLFNLLILGTLSAAFLPVFTSYLARGEEGRKEAFHVAHTLVTITFLILTVFSIVLWIFAPFLARLIAPGFTGERLMYTILLSRIMLLQTILLGVSSILGGILTSFGRFISYAAAPVLYNIGIILGVLFFVPRLGVAGLAWGVVCGALFHLLVQVPDVWRLGFRFRPMLSFGSEGLWRVGRLIIPRFVGLIAGQVGDFLVTIIGSQLLLGSIAIYTFAENLQSVPIGIIGVSFAVAAFPQLSVSAAQNAAETFLETFIRSMRLILFLILPMSVFLLLLRAQLVRVILGTGAFTADANTRTYSVLGILVLSVFAQSLIPLLARAFFALQDTRTPALVSLMTILVNVVTALFFVQPFNVLGLALASTVSAILNFVLLLTVLHMRLGGLQDRILLSAVLKMSLLVLAAGILTQAAKVLLAFVVDVETPLGVLTQLVGAGLVGMATYGLLAALFQVEEWRWLTSTVLRWPLKPFSSPSRP